MKDLKVYKKLLIDVKSRVENHGYDVQTHFDSESSAIRILRKEDNVVVFKIVEKVKGNESPMNSQLKAYFFFLSYLMFYGVFTVSFSYDEEMKEKLEKAKKEKEKKKKEKDE